MINALHQSACCWLVISLHIWNSIRIDICKEIFPPLLSSTSINSVLKFKTKNLRLVNTAIVEDQVHAGKLLSRLLWLQIQLYYTSVTYKESQNTILSVLSPVFPYFYSVQLILSHTVIEGVCKMFQEPRIMPKPKRCIVKCYQPHFRRYLSIQFLYKLTFWSHSVSAGKQAEPGAESIELVERKQFSCPRTLLRFVQ